MPVTHPARRPRAAIALAGVAAAVLAISGCSTSSPSSTANGAGSGPSAPTSQSSGRPSVVGTSQAGSPLPASSAASHPTAPSISIPPYLCDVTDIAQNAADAYMGALSAGDLKQAQACVLPGAVPAAVTSGLLATTKGTAVYLPRNGVDGPKVFGYQGGGKSIDVTVTKERDGKFWVTAVVVRPA